MVGTVVKSNIGELEEEVRAGSLISTRTELTGVLKVLSYKKRLFVRFQYGCKSILYLNQLTIVILEKITEEKELEVSEIDEIPEEQL